MEGGEKVEDEEIGREGGEKEGLGGGARCRNSSLFILRFQGTLILDTQPG